MKILKKFWNKLSYWKKGGIISFVFLWIYIWILSYSCDAIQGLCVISLFLIQAPAFYFTIFIENLYQVEVSYNQLRLIFIVITTLFWVVVGILIGFVFGWLKSKK